MFHNYIFNIVKHKPKSVTFHIFYIERKINVLRFTSYTNIIFEKKKVFVTKTKYFNIKNYLFIFG